MITICWNMLVDRGVRQPSKERRLRLAGTNAHDSAWPGWVGGARGLEGARGSGAARGRGSRKGTRGATRMHRLNGKRKSFQSARLCRRERLSLVLGVARY